MCEVHIWNWYLWQIWPYRIMAPCLRLSLAATDLPKLSKVTQKIKHILTTMWCCSHTQQHCLCADISMATYLLTPWIRVLLEKLTGSATSQEIPRIFGTRKFIAVLTSARHPSLSWANSTQSSQPPHTSCRSILILSSHLRLGLPNGLFPSGFPTRSVCTPLPSPIRATFPAHLILLDFTTLTIFGKECRSLSSSLCNFLHSPVTSSLDVRGYCLKYLWLSVVLSTCSLNTAGCSTARPTIDGRIILKWDYRK